MLSVHHRSAPGAAAILYLSATLVVPERVRAQALEPPPRPAGDTLLPTITVEARPRQRVVRKAPTPIKTVLPVRAPGIRAMRPTETAIRPAATAQPAAAQNNASTQQTTAGSVQGYRALTAVSATKTNTPIEQIPQTIQVVPRSVIDDQVDLTVEEAVRNVSNVQAPNALGLTNIGIGAAATIRGFPAEEWLDGLTVVDDAGWRDAIANVERIEVLKGPNALLYGGGSGAPIGGAINVISKLPVIRPSVEVDSTFGSYGYRRPYFDINQPLTTNNNVLFRVTGEFLDARSFVNVLHADKYSINPTLTFTNQADTSLTIQGRVSRATQQEYSGLPATGTVTGDFRFNPRSFLQNAALPRSFSDVQSVTVTFDHQFGPGLSTDVKARWSKERESQKSQILVNGDLTGATPLVPPSTWGFANTSLQQQQTEFTINPSLQGRFDVGPSTNIVLVGADYARVTDNGYFQSDFLPDLVDLAEPNPAIPKYNDPDPSSPGFAPFSNYHSSYTTRGVYVQLQSNIYERFHLLTGVRAANVDIDYYERVIAQRTVTDVTRPLPRAGLLVDIVKGFSVYGSYSEGLRGVPFVSAYLMPRPETSQQVEAGVKFNLADQLSGTADYFEVKRRNIALSAGLGTAAYSNQLSRGVEADLIWQPAANVQVIGSYGHADVIFADALFGVPPGNKVPIVPADSGRLWANYAFTLPALRGWSVGAGIYAAGPQYVDFANLYRTPGFHTFDAKVAYTSGPFTASLDVKNLSDERYYVPYSWLNGQVAPGNFREFYGRIAYRY